MCEHQPEQEQTIEPTPSADVVATLVANHRAFLAFVERRVGSRDIAEETLQNAFVKSVEKFETVRDAAVGWFYRVLRNAIIDHRRRKAVADKYFDRFTTDAEPEPEDAELHAVVCKCVGELAATLKPEYAEALRSIEVEGVSVKDYADQLGISSSNAGVRVFRARDAVRKQVARACGTCADHGCLDCTCAKTPAGASSCGHH